jgi:hypothetical protein
MIENTIKKLDVEQVIGRVTLSDGKTRLDIPRLSMRKIIQIVKFLGIDGAKLYSEFADTIADPELSDIEKFTVILEGLDDAVLIRIFSILLEMDDEDTLNLDPNEMLEITLVYAEKVDFGKTFLLIKKLYKTIFKKEMPDLRDLFQQAQQANQEMEQKRQAALQPMKAGQRAGMTS